MNPKNKIVGAVLSVLCAAVICAVLFTAPLGVSIGVAFLMVLCGLLLFSSGFRKATDSPLAAVLGALMILGGLFAVLNLCKPVYAQDAANNVRVGPITFYDNTGSNGFFLSPSNGLFGVIVGGTNYYGINTNKTFTQWTGVGGTNTATIRGGLWVGIQ